MHSIFSIKLAFIALLSFAVEVSAQDNPLKPVDQTVEDVSGLSTSFRYIEPGLLMPSGFQQVYRYSGRTDFFVRIDGATHAVFPESVYVPTRNGIQAATPAGTIYYIGDQFLRDTINNNAPNPAQSQALGNNDSSGRLIWRIQPQLELPNQPVQRAIGFKNVQVIDPIEAGKRSMSRLKVSDAPDIIANSTYRYDRIHNLMKSAANAAKKRSEKSGSE